MLFCAILRPFSEGSLLLLQVLLEPTMLELAHAGTVVQVRLLEPGMFSAASIICDAGQDFSLKSVSSPRVVEDDVTKGKEEDAQFYGRGPWCATFFDLALSADGFQHSRLIPKEINHLWCALQI